VNHPHTMQFEARWGIHVKIMTIGGTAVCLGAPLWFNAAGGAPDSPLLSWCMEAPLFLWLVCLLLTVRGYTITDDSILIHRLICATRLQLEPLNEVDFNPPPFARAIRFFGNGGMFGICGLYYERKIGTFRAFVTDTAQPILLKFPSRSIVISPRDPRRFVSELLGRTDQLSEA
jgi:hypothetical protein